MYGVSAFYRQTAYGVAKGAIITLTEYVATSFGRDNIRCNAIAPSMTENEADISAFIDEVLRFYTPVAGTWRIAREDMSLGGVDIPSGSILMVRLDSANRDPGQFEWPDTFDIDRKGNARHFSFGGGAHSCIGFRVAKLELQHSIAALLKRLKSPRLIEDGTDLDIVPSTHARCIKRLRIGFEPETPGR